MKRLIKKTHFDNVNAMRFFALFTIFFAHCFITNNQQIKVASLFLDLRQVSSNLNTAAYSFLFILTGFLNTWSIFEERFIYKTMNLLRFYMRRFLTLLPLYFVLFFIGNYIIQYIGFHSNLGSDHEISAIRYLTFSFNFNYLETWETDAIILGNMWSVAALLQILVVWPILMKIFRRNEGIMFILLGITFIVTAWYVNALPVSINKEGMAEYHPFIFNTINVMFDFMIGSYIAYFSFFKYKTYGFLKKVSKRTIGFLYLGFLAYLIFRNRLLCDFGKEVSPLLLFLADKILVSALAGFFLFEQNFCSNSVFKLAKIKFLSATEKYMYGMYVMIPFGAYYGYKLISFFKSEETLTMVLFAEPLLGFIITIVLAVLSYEFIEKSFLKMKKEYQPTRDYAPNIANDAKA